MADRTTWYETEIHNAVKDDVIRRMARAAIVVRDQVKILSNRSNPDGKHPSLPGEPPKKVSGRFVKSVTSKVIVQGNDVIGLIGSDVPYQPRLELGFIGTDKLGRRIHQLPRPAFRPALEMSRRTIAQLLGVA